MVSAYLTVDAMRNEVEERLAQIAGSFPQLCTRISLPYETASPDRLTLGENKRICSVLRIGPAPAAKGPLGRVHRTPRGVLFVGGVHGDEFGGAEVCLNFAEQLLDAYTAGTGLSFQVEGLPPKTFSAFHVSAVVERLNVFVFPLVNPDGRAQKTRKNANGVDISRNFNFLWDNPLTGGSNDKNSRFYRGTSAESEFETKNLVHLIDTFKNITGIVDIHTRISDGPIILYPWAHDLYQTTDPSMNFTADAAANGWTVGRIIHASKDYKEYIAPTDLDYMTKAAVKMRDAINSVRGTDYHVGPGTDYGKDAKVGISGTPTDFFFSRHVTDRSYRTVYGWLIEYGGLADGQANYRVNGANPECAEMDKIIQEVNAGMMELCIHSIAYGWLIEKLLTVVYPISDFWRRIFRNRQR